LIQYCLSWPAYVIEKETYSLARFAIFHDCIEPVNILSTEGEICIDKEKVATLTQNLKEFTYKINLMMVGGNFEAAREFFDNLVQIAKENTEYYQNLAKAFRFNKFCTKPLEDFKKAPVLFLENGMLIE